MTGDLKIVPASADNFEDLLDLIQAYQKFYEVRDIDRERNRNFFSRFLKMPDEGLQFIAYQLGKPVGFTTLYFPYSSTRASRFALMNDLYVSSQARGAGIGAALIEKAREIAAANGFDDLAWMTAQNNERAQSLYDRFDAQRTAWYEYCLEAKPGI